MKTKCTINFYTIFTQIQIKIWVAKNDVYNLGLNLRKKDNLDEFREYYYIIKKCDNLSVIQSGNLYVYAVNNPLNFKDSYGEAVYGVGIEIGGGFGFYVSGQAYYVIDSKGNKGIFIVGNVGGGLGKGVVGSGFYYPNMDNIWELEGLGGSASMSLGVGVGYTVSGGYSGINVSIHRRFYKLTPGFSGTVGYGKIIYSWWYYEVNI